MKIHRIRSDDSQTKWIRRFVLDTLYSGAGYSLVIMYF